MSKSKNVNVVQNLTMINHHLPCEGWEVFNTCKYNWLHNNVFPFFCFNSQRDRAHPAETATAFAAALFTHASILSVCSRMLEYSLNLQNVSFSAVRTVRVLRPLRAINRVPSECRSLLTSHIPDPHTLHHFAILGFLSLFSKSQARLPNF